MSAQMFVDVGGGHQLFVRTGGAGPAVIVPATYGSDEFTALAASYRVVLYDPRGRGSSPATGRTDVTFQTDVDDLERLRAALDLPRMSLVGWSYFGAVAARYAIDWPDRVERLVIVSSIPIRRERAAAMRREQAVRLNRSTPKLMARVREGVRLKPAELRAIAYAMMLTRCGRQPPWPGDTDRVLGALCGTDTGRRSYLSTITRLIATLGDWDWRIEARRIACPTLVIYGRGDLLPEELCAEWVDAIPSSRGLILEGVGHFPSLEAPEVFFPLVMRFLDGHWPALTNTVRGLESACLPEAGSLPPEAVAGPEIAVAGLKPALHHVESPRGLDASTAPPAARSRRC